LRNAELPPNAFGATTAKNSEFGVGMKRKGNRNVSTNQETRKARVKKQEKVGIRNVECGISKSEMRIQKITALGFLLS
jgi:hypothetical protein